MNKYVLLTLVSFFLIGSIISHAAGQEIESGTFPKNWINGGPDCDKEPEVQVHAYNIDLFILRQSGCTHHEMPFMYLIIGEEKAILFDTGAGKINIGKIVETVLSSWLARKQRARSSLELVVTHTHSHPDHRGGDREFINKKGTTFVGVSYASVTEFFNLRNWPHQASEYDLGNRIIDIIPIPGHDRVHLAAYDRKTGILLTGDTIYPGRLYIDISRSEYTASIKRLLDFTKSRPVTHVLGGHVEQKKMDFKDYPVGTAYQPEERELQLKRRHIMQVYDALRNHSGSLPIKLPELSICPPYPRC